jgi:hypothetical protein
LPAKRSDDCDYGGGGDDNKDDYDYDDHHQHHHHDYVLNPLTLELNPSTQRCLTRLLLGILLLELYISLMYA